MEYMEARMQDRYEAHDDYWKQDIAVRLLERANTARQEGHATAVGDAVHFEQAEKEIRQLREEIMAAKVLLESRAETIRQLTEERAEQWRQRREAEGSRDAARAAADSMKIERDAMREAMEGIVHFSDALDFRQDHLSKALRQWIHAGRAIIAKAEGK